MPEHDRSAFSKAVFALGHADASLSFLKLLPQEAQEQVSAIVALQLLETLWKQYRVDRGIGYGRTLLGVDNGYEQRVFTALVAELAEWQPLRAAIGQIRAHSPALSIDERAPFDAIIDDQRDLLLDVREQFGRLPADIDPTGQASLLIDRCQKLDLLDDFGICWALNLGSAFGLNMLGRAKASAPFPSLFRREMLRFDRTKAWRERALDLALTQSAHAVSASVFRAYHFKSAFEIRFPDLRSSSRLLTAFIYLAGMGELTPSLLSRLVGCSEPGARKMLRKLEYGGLALSHRPSPAFQSIESYRLGSARAPWLSGNTRPAGIIAAD